jgi:hypothetical protein
LGRHHRRREIYVGSSTVAAIVGQKLAPRRPDIYLGRTGYDSQQCDGNADPLRPDNLWQPVPGDFAAHGEFDDRAHKQSLELWSNQHRWAIALGLAGLPSAFMQRCASRHDHG